MDGQMEQIDLGFLPFGPLCSNGTANRGFESNSLAFVTRDLEISIHHPADLVL